jgi:hypothetical protein
MLDQVFSIGASDNGEVMSRKRTKGTAMKKRNIFVIAAAGLLLSACIPSINPFYTDKDVVFEKKLLGEWQEKENPGEPQNWNFEESKDKAYKLTVTEKGGKQSEFEAHLFKLKQDYFLDIMVTEIGTNVADLAKVSLIPGHLLLRISQFDPELKLAMTDIDWLDKYLKEHPKALAHHRDVERVFLTAETPDLQSFVQKHLGEDELFGKPGEMIRKAKKEPATEPADKK